MLTSKVAKRYAKGLLELTQERQQTTEVLSDMKALIKILNESQELNRFLQAPFLDHNKKMQVAKEVFKSFLPVVQNLILLVIKNGRATHLKNIAQAYINKVEDLHGVQRVTLTTAAPLSQENIDKILQSSKMINAGSKPDLKVIIKPELLGGYILRVGDQQLDTSVRSKLANMKKEFQLN